MKYRVVNRKRFIIFCTVGILIYTGIMSAFMSVVLSHDKENLTVMEVMVRPGDTVWKLAKEYGPSDRDIRKVVYDICALNEIKAGELAAGQTILIEVD